MKVTDEMVAAFVRGYGTGVGGVPRGLAAVLELIENSPVAVVPVSRELWDSMKRDVVTLRRLEAAGVDNWQHYDAAMGHDDDE